MKQIPESLERFKKVPNCMYVEDYYPSNEDQINQALERLYFLNNNNVLKLDKSDIQTLNYFSDQLVNNGEDQRIGMYKERAEILLKIDHILKPYVTIPDSSL